MKVVFDTNVVASATFWRGAPFDCLAAWAQGDVSTALETFTQAVTSLHAAGNLVDELTLTIKTSALDQKLLTAKVDDTRNRITQLQGQTASLQSALGNQADAMYR